MPLSLNLGVGQDLTIKDLATKIARLVNFKSKFFGIRLSQTDL